MSHQPPQPKPPSSDSKHSTPSATAAESLEKRKHEPGYLKPLAREHVPKDIGIAFADAILGCPEGTLKPSQMAAIVAEAREHMKRRKESIRLRLLVNNGLQRNGDIHPSRWNLINNLVNGKDQ